MPGEEVVEDAYVAVVGEAEVADASGAAFFGQEVEDAVVDVAVAELFHAVVAHAYAVEQHVVDVVGLELLEGIAVHGYGGVAGLALGGEVG